MLVAVLAGGAVPNQQTSCRGSSLHPPKWPSCESASPSHTLFSQSDIGTMPRIPSCLLQHQPCCKMKIRQVMPRPHAFIGRYQHAKLLSVLGGIKNRQGRQRQERSQEEFYDHVGGNLLSLPLSWGRAHLYHYPFLSRFYIFTRYIACPWSSIAP